MDTPREMKYPLLEQGSTVQPPVGAGQKKDIGSEFYLNLVTVFFKLHASGDVVPSLTSGCVETTNQTGLGKIRAPTATD